MNPKQKQEYDAGLAVGRTEHTYRSPVVTSYWMDGWRDGQRERIKKGLPVNPASREQLTTADAS